MAIRQYNIALPPELWERLHWIWMLERRWVHKSCDYESFQEWLRTWARGLVEEGYSDKDLARGERRWKRYRNAMLRKRIKLLDGQMQQAAAAGEHEYRHRRKRELIAKATDELKRRRGRRTK